MTLQQRILSELAGLESQAQMRHLETFQGVLNLSSNDYLGLARDPRMFAAVAAALQAEFPITATGSRLLSGHHPAWSDLESQFAAWVNRETALYFTSGYLANVGLLGSVLQPDDVVFSDSANHASLIDGMRLAKSRRIIFPHLCLEALEDQLRKLPARGARFIVVESIFSMDGARAPLAELSSLAARYDAALIVDEAHATGVCGERGAGCVAQAGLSEQVFATVHTCGKALAAAGAFVCGSAALRTLLINRARTFVFSTALPPYFAAQVGAGIRLAQTADAARTRLARHSAFLTAALHANGFETAGSASHIVPVILGSNETALEFAARLRARGYGVRAIRPPTVPPDTARLRLSLTADIPEGALADLSEALVEIRSAIAATQHSVPIPG